MKWICKIFFIFYFIVTHSQEMTHYEDSLISQLSLVHHEKDYDKSMEYNDQFKKLLERVLKHSNSFKYNFDSLSKFMSTNTSPDNVFRIFNWNIQLNNQKQFYECWILFSDQQIIKLKDLNREIPEIEYATLKPETWLGALYFNIIPVYRKNQTIYTLLGWDGNDMFSNKKTIESMTISKKKKIEFGTPIFEYPNGPTKKRVIFQYNKKSYMSLKHKRIRKEDYLVFDHLSPTSPHLKDFPDWYVTDLSFDAFKWEENKWKYKRDFDAKSLKILKRPFNDPNK